MSLTTHSAGGPYRLGFGEHKGKQIRELPNGYLIWLYENVQTERRHWGAQAWTEIKRRGLERPPVNVRERTTWDMVINPPEPIEFQDGWEVTADPRDEPAVDRMFISPDQARAAYRFFGLDLAGPPEPKKRRKPKKQSKPKTSPEDAVQNWRRDPPMILD